jgi:RND family efflux transporter MFP subunit
VDTLKSEEGSSGATWIKRLLSYAFLLAAVAVALWFLMESKKEAASTPDEGIRAESPAAEIPLVRVQEVVEEKITRTMEYVGRVEAVDSVDLIARVSGYLESINFVEGRYVKAGDLMFTIEKNRFRAEVESRKGTISQIEANLVEAEKYLRRLKSAKRESVPEKDIEAAERDVDYFRAQLVSAKADLDLAEIDLGYTEVRAPMSGRVTKKNYSVGDYVGPNSGTIATIVQFDPIRVVCSMSEVEYLNLMEQTGSSPEKIFRPALRLPNGTLYPGKGRWDFADTAIDASTGTISLRSRYSNPDGLLIPGGYVTVVLSSVRGETLPLVPQAAVAESREGSYVYVVGDDNAAELRLIRKRSVLGTDWIVEEGIKPGETVIVEGIQKVHPGQRVKIAAAAEAIPVTGVQ